MTADRARSRPQGRRRAQARPDTGTPPGSAERAFLSIGELSQRAGLAPSALRYYEAQGLISSSRSAGNQRQYPREVLRRVAFIRAAQALGLPLETISTALAGLPEGRTPTREDWARLSASWRPLLDARIAELSRLRDQLTSCIGCGCLSLPSCALYNQGDSAGRRGAGARYLLGDRPVPLRRR